MLKWFGGSSLRLFSNYFVSCFSFKLFLKTKRVTTKPENQRSIFKSLLLSYFIIYQTKMEQNTKYCIDSAKTYLKSSIITRIHRNSKS